MYEDLTKKQLEIFEFMKKEQRQKGYPPSVREIGEAVGLRSPSSVHSQLTKLENKGYIKKDPAKPRAIEIMDPYYGDNDNNDSTYDQCETVHVPIVGQVTAGQPILAVENIVSTFPLPADFTKHHECFILSVKGDSMIEAGIFNGDYIVVQRAQAADNGDIVVALVDGDEATIKRFFKEKDHVRLQPENAAMEPILSRNVSILGKVSGVIRKL